MTLRKFVTIGVTAAVFIFLLKMSAQYVPFAPYQSFARGT